MRRLRLRSAYSDEELRRIYAAPHDHRKFPDHQQRIDRTIEVAEEVVDGEDILYAADLSCGNGAVLEALDVPEKVFGDFAPGYPITGPIERTVTAIGGVDLFVLGETLEHVDDPETLLLLIRQVTKNLVLSTPIDAFDDDNPEHYWAWDREGVDELLSVAGFSIERFDLVDTRPGGPYVFGIWWAR